MRSHMISEEKDMHLKAPTVRALFVISLLVLLPIAACTGQASPGETPQVPAQPANPELILATTTDTQESGLLDVLVPAFESRTGYRVKTIAVDIGQALKTGEKGEADVLLLHAPDLEEKYMEQENGKDRWLVMHSDFVLVGPDSDRAGVKQTAGISGALQKIYRTGSLFMSQGDNSGTDVLEKKLWKGLGFKPEEQSWYTKTGQGTGATLNIASEKQAYAVTDRATFLAQKGRLKLVIVHEGDAPLLNIYHVITVNPEKSTKVNYAGAKAFAEFILSRPAQQMIAKFGLDKYGQPLFFADAGKPEMSLFLPMGSGAP